MIKISGRRSRLGKMSSSPKPVQATPQLTVPETKEEVISIQIKQCKVVVTVNIEEKIPTETPIQAETIFKAEATIKTKDIIKA